MTTLDNLYTYRSGITFDFNNSFVVGKIQYNMKGLQLDNLTKFNKI